MTRRIAAPALLAFALASTVSAQTPPRYPERAVRRDIPITNIAKRSFAAGSRDSSGRPARNYWQVRADYTIKDRKSVV